MKVKLILIILLLVICMFFNLPAAQANEKNKVILLVVDYLKLSDFYLSPALQELSRDAGIGLLNVNTGATRTIPHTYATVNAGRTVSTPRSGIEIYSSGEKVNDIPALEIFRSKTGYNPPPTAIVLLSLPQLLEQNKESTNVKAIGLLGDQLTAAGLTTAVLGNADLPNLKDRSSALIGINSFGYIQQGDVSNALNKMTNDFLGLRTDYDRLLKTFKEVYSQADFIIVTLGDLVRLERCQAEALPHLIVNERKEIIKEIAAFIKEVKKITSVENDLILAGALSQNPQNAQGENRLLPFFIFGNMIDKESILTSGTTKRPGIIANIDLTATILNHFNLPYSSTSGRPLTVARAEENAIAYLTKLNQKLSFVHDSRNYLVKTYVLLQIGTLLGAIPVLIFLPKLAQLMKVLLLALTCYPLSLLLLGAINTNSIVVYSLMSIAITAFIVFVSTQISKNWLISFLLVEALTAFVILFDLATGANLAKFSPLSYQVITGARYYGIGNEYMGVLIGSVIIASSIAYHLSSQTIIRILITGFFILTCLFIALPHLGINFGGTITAILAFSFALLAWQGVKPSFKKAFQLGIACLICIGLLVFYDLNQSVETQSHLGRTVALIEEYGLIELWLIVIRKIAMNVKLFRYTIWSRVFITSLLASVFLLFRPISIFNTLKVQYPKLFYGFWATIVGSIIALFTNDSGIVASATMVIYSALPLVCLAFDHRLTNLRDH